MKRTILFVVMALALTIAPSAASTREMTTHRAGKVYLHAVCPSNSALTHFQSAIWHGRKTITFKEIGRRLPEIRRLSGQLYKANFNTVKRFLHPPADWPSDVARPIANITSGYEKYSRWAGAMSNASTARGWVRYWTDWKHVKFGNAPITIRARLNLPAPGRGC